MGNILQEVILNSIKRRIFICFGDSGMGKSSFINFFKKNYEIKAETSDDGNSCTKSASIHSISHPLLGEFDLVDTKGTNDTAEFDSVSILESLLDYFIKLKEIYFSNEISIFLFF